MILALKSFISEAAVKPNLPNIPKIACIAYTSLFAKNLKKFDFRELRPLKIKKLITAMLTWCR